MRDLVLAYYYVLRAALQGRPHLRPCLTRCRHCRIFFLVDPRNRGRKDLGCPFGCRDAQRKECSAARSTAYYRTEAGKQKKAGLNRNRKRRAEVDPESKAAEERSASALPEVIELNPGIVEHVRVVTSLIEGFAVSRQEVVAMLEKAVRQRSMVGERRVDYVLRWLAEHPP